MAAKEKTRIYILLLAFVPSILWVAGLSTILNDLITPGIGSALGERDFANYWLGGQIAVEGMTRDLYQFKTYFPKLQEAFGNGVEIRNWSYPPHTLLFLWPLGFLSYKSAVLVFFGSGLGLYLVAASKFQHEYGARGYDFLFWAIHLPFMIMMLYCMQNGFHFAALALFGFLFMKKRPIIAGICFAIMTTKPQLGILVPVLLLMLGAWRCIFWSALFTTLFVGMSIFIFGITDWYDYISYSIPYQSNVMHNWDGIFLRMMPSLFSALRVLQVESDLALNIHLIFAAILTPAILWFLYEAKSDLNRIFILVIGTFILTPYSFNYDMGVFVTLCGVYLTRSMNEGSNHGLLWALLAVYTTAMMLLGTIGIPIGPVVLSVAFIMFVSRRQDTSNANPIGVASSQSDYIRP